MKYLFVGLMLIAGALGHVPATPPTPRQTFASAQFQVSAAGVETVADIYVSASRGPARIGLSIERKRVECGDDGCQAAISGYTYQNASPGDALVDPVLDHASVHATILFHDRVTNTNIPVRVDAVWAATGPAQCSDRNDETGCDRAAAVTGEVTIGATPFIAGQNVPGGLLQWRVPAW